MRTGKPIHKRDYLTSGEVARLCSFSARHTIKLCDRGLIESFRLPGSDDRRVPRRAFLDFLAKFKLPVPLGFETSAVTFGLAADEEVFGSIPIVDPIAMGMKIERELVCRAVVSDGHGLQVGLLACAAIRGKCSWARIVFVASPDISLSSISREIVDEVRHRPCSWEEITKLVYQDRSRDQDSR